MIHITDLEIKDIKLIENLWIMNKDYHSNISSYFRENYGDLDFSGRFDKLTNMEAHKISVAKDDEDIIGYIISVINESKGEHLSFHVNESYRGKGIGTSLLNEHIKWLKNQDCKSIAIKVSYENNSTIDFYKSKGFMPDTLDMYLK